MNTQKNSCYRFIFFMVIVLSALSQISMMPFSVCNRIGFNSETSLPTYLSSKELTEYALSRNRVDATFLSVAKNQETIFVAQSQPAKSYVWMARGKFVTKPYSVKPKSAPDNSPIGGLIPINQKFSKLRGNQKLVNKYQKMVNNLLLSGEAIAVKVVVDDKIAAVHKKNGREEVMWLDQKKVSHNTKLVYVLANKEGDRYVSDVDGLLMATKMHSANYWDQNRNSNKYGKHAKGHIDFAKKVNNKFGPALINHSSCHSWDEGTCRPSYPLVAYTPDGAELIKKGPKHDPHQHLNQFNKRQSAKGYNIRTHRDWS